MFLLGRVMKAFRMKSFIWMLCSQIIQRKVWVFQIDSFWIVLKEILLKSSYFIESIPFPFSNQIEQNETIGSCISIFPFSYGLNDRKIFMWIIWKWRLHSCRYRKGRQKIECISSLYIYIYIILFKHTHTHTHTHTYIYIYIYTYIHTI